MQYQPRIPRSQGVQIPSNIPNIPNVPNVPNVRNIPSIYHTQYNVQQSPYLHNVSNVQHRQPLEQRVHREEKEFVIIHGKHDELREFIYDILRKYPKLNKKNIDKLLTEHVMKEFKKVFTSPSVDPTNNYEFYEILGDSTANNCIVWYCQRRFFSEVESVITYKDSMSPLAIMGRLKQILASTKQFSNFATKLNFQPYISMSSTDKNIKILEDVFEAFLGCLVYFCDKIFDMHIGFSVVYAIIEKLMDQEDIKIDRDSLYEPKSQLNEDITKFRDNIRFYYEHREIEKDVPTSGFISRAIIVEKDTGNRIETQSVKGSEKKFNEQKLAKMLMDMNEYKELKRKFNIN